LSFKALIFISDTDACRQYRISQPFAELHAQYGVEYLEYCFMPTGEDPFWDMINMIKSFDLVIVQRCYLLSAVEIVKKVTDFLGIPLIFETDDCYTNLLPDNPAYYGMARNQDLYRKWQEANNIANHPRINPDERSKFAAQAAEMIPDLEKSRLEGVQDYKTLLASVDAITTTSEELARTIYPYNKNVRVFSNNVVKVYPWRDSVDLKLCASEDGKMFKIPHTLGFFIIPNRVTDSRGKSKTFTRVGYSTSPSRMNEDWETVRSALDAWSIENIEDHYIITMEDPDNLHFASSLSGLKKGKVIPIPYAPFDKYNMNLRNFDIALAPLTPTYFNTCRSEIKLLEAGAWGVPGLAPNLVTYNRAFKHEENCMLYYNDREFVQYLQLLHKNRPLREKLGKSAFDFVSSERLEKHHAKARYDFYTDLIQTKKRMINVSKTTV
jgi:glycosyltransferase involved in cell wall biosynthesis